MEPNTNLLTWKTTQNYSPNQTKLSEVIGVFLYYARTVDCTILLLPALGLLATQQLAPTQKYLIENTPIS